MIATITVNGIPASDSVIDCRRENKEIVCSMFLRSGETSIVKMGKVELDFLLWSDEDLIFGLCEIWDTVDA